MRDPACQNAPQDDPLAFLLTAPPIRWVCSRTKTCRNRKSCRRATGRVTNAARTHAAIDPQSDAPVVPAVLPGADQDKLIAALLEGMGLNNGHQTPITEEQMRVTGRMLSLFSQGTVALLSSRSILKRGVADMTMILTKPITRLNSAFR